MSKVKKVSSKGTKNQSQKDLLKGQNEVLESTSNLTDQQILDSLNKLDLSEIKVKEKKSSVRSNENFYNYEFLFTKYQKRIFKELSKDDFKKYGNRLRTKIRKIRNTFANNIKLYQQQSNIVELKREIKLFNLFYKETYCLNDYSVKSISSTNRDEDTNLLLSDMFKIILILK